MKKTIYNPTSTDCRELGNTCGKFKRKKNEK